MYKNAHYEKNFNGDICCIMVMIEGQEFSIPLDPANSDYAAIMKLQEEGKLTIAPAEGN